MATLTDRVSLRSDRSAPLLPRIADLFGLAFRRIVASRYAEQRERIARSGTAGMI